MAYYHKPATSSGDEELALNENRSDLPFQLISITPQPPSVSLSSLDPTTLTFAGLDYHPAPLQSPSPLPMPVLNYETQKSTTTHFDEPDSPQKTYTQRPTLGLPRQSSNSHHLNRRHHWLPKLALILVLLLQSLIVIGFFASVYIYLDGRVSTDGNVEYRTILAYLVRSFFISSPQTLVFFFFLSFFTTSLTINLIFIITHLFGMLNSPSFFSGWYGSCHLFFSICQTFSSSLSLPPSSLSWLWVELAM